MDSRYCEMKLLNNPVSILYKSIAGRYRPVSYPDGPITARYRFIKNAGWEETISKTQRFVHSLHPGLGMRTSYIFEGRDSCK